MGQEDVDRGGLALAPGLGKELDERVFGGIRLDDRDGVVGARAGDDDDLNDLDVARMLRQQRLQQPADVRLFVVGGDADAAAQLWLVVIQ